ncbi:hypothetical protein DRZ78_01405 [Candidatus Aerophobetes bacterium]|uniref:Asp23/Gls24 family envelope stress response protein n=1 Tax=Aerophobetes bacterium TaxID=2030807 RepID=A0A662D2C5_UNCAE|nr:MAG: hypothetical protein DRZ78_01405 [Candidatus Aerophobetes bacterium]
MEKKRGYKVDRKVITDFIKKSLREIEGIHSVKKGLWGDKVKFKETAEGMRISIGLTVKEGKSIPQVVEEAQRKLKEEIEKTFGTSVLKIDIQIKGIESSQS